MHDLKKLMEKKKKDGKALSDTEKEAKMSVVKGLRDMASDMIGDRIAGLKKVTVASNSKEGLQKGLEMAKAKVEGEEEAPMEEEQEGSEGQEESEHEEAPHESEEEMSEEELDAKLAKLMALKKQMEEKKA